MDRFIHTQNLLRYVDMLEKEADPIRRERLRSLLIEEEDRFGSEREWLDEAELYIVQSRSRIRRQEEIVAHLRRDGRDSEQADRLLTNMSDLLQLFQQRRDQLQASVRSRY